MDILLSHQRGRECVWYHAFPYMIEEAYKNNNKSLLEKLLDISNRNNSVIFKTEVSYDRYNLRYSHTIHYFYVAEWSGRNGYGIVRILESTIKLALKKGNFDRVFELTKLRYKGRYDFSLNRSVDDESKGMNSQDNISVKIITQFSSLQDDTSFASESITNNALIVDMTQGEYISELIRANRIAIFKRNNSASMSVAMTEIMAKKSAELSERLKRAEDIIRETLRTAKIYYNGTELHIKEKDGKDRLTDALNQVVEQEYYKLGLVSYFYNEQKDVLNVLNNQQGSLIETDITKESNYPAYQEIFNKIKNDKAVLKKTTMKALIEYFSKKPFGWRDLDVLGMVACLLKAEAVQISRHEVAVDLKDYSFKNDFIKKNGLDVMVIRVQEKIDDAVLYKVKTIMSQVYSVTVPIFLLKYQDGLWRLKRKVFAICLLTKKK